MRSYRQTCVSVGLGCLFMTLTACGKSEPPPAQRPMTPPPAAPVTPPPATTTSRPAPAEITVSDVELGKQIGSDKRVTQEVTTFAPNDTIYASVVTNGATPSATLSAKWMYQDGQVVDEATQTIKPTGPTATEFHISKPDGWPTGNYKLEVSLNGKVASTKEFEVKG